MDPIQDDLQLDDEEAGTTRILTSEGWEDSLYVEPDESWDLQEDGSWISPDGLTQSWPMVGPEADHPT